MKKTICLIFVTLIISSCFKNEKQDLIEKIKELEAKNKELRSELERFEDPLQIKTDSIPKNYIKRKIQNADIYIPNMIKVHTANMEYTKDYENMYMYLNVEVKNSLNRKIKSILFQLKSIDCKDADFVYLSENTQILPDSTKIIKINIHSQVVEKFRIDCLQHTPIVEVLP